MNNHRKYKKKKLNLASFPSEQFVEDQEKQATQNLFNISNCWEEGKKDAHPEADIFNSVNSEEIQPQQNNKTPVKDNYFRLTSKRDQTHQAKEIQKIMDKQFIRESKNLLKLYTTPDNQKNQNTLRQSTSIKTKNDSFIKKEEKPNNKKGKLNILCNTFKSDSVFVVKRKIIPEKSEIQKSKSRLEELKSSREKVQMQRNHQFFMNTQKSGYFSPHRNSFQGNSKKSPQHNSISHQNSKASEYQQIDNFRTLNSMKWMLLKNSLENNRQSIQLTAENYISSFTLTTHAFHTSQNRSEQKQKNSSFRKRFTFYKDQKNKVKDKLIV